MEMGLERHVWVPVRDEAGWALARVEQVSESDVVLARCWPTEGSQLVISKTQFETLVPAPSGPPQASLRASAFPARASMHALIPPRLHTLARDILFPAWNAACPSLLAGVSSDYRKRWATL